MRSRTEIELSSGGESVLRLVSSSLPGRPLITKTWVPGGTSVRSALARWAMYALVVSSWTSRSRAALSWRAACSSADAFSKRSCCSKKARSGET